MHGSKKILGIQVVAYRTSYKGKKMHVFPSFVSPLDPFFSHVEHST
jgi:hypothetical protein